ncbi:MAG: glycosyltransferase family 4 protein, partial [Solirubrobacterales bacterium]|nr:glycosyltransferase family 4 protein [Solirubrobacterales bacterium]
MRVALLNPVFWPEVRRGSERVVRELADGLLDRGHRVRLITSHPRRVGVAIEDGLEVQRVWRPPIEARLQRRLHEEHLAHLPLATRALRHYAPDVAHALYATDAVAALRAAVAPVVFSYMGIPHRRSLANRRGRKELVVRACAEASAVVALSQVAAEGFERWLGVTPHVIAPGVDLVAFAPDPAARAEVPTILCAGDHTQPRKRVGLLVEAFGLLRADVPDARLILSAGADGPSRWAA